MTVLERATGHFGKAFRLLLIEDDPVWVEIVGGWLRSPLWEVNAARGWEDVQRMQRKPESRWSCIIADIELSGGSGRTGIDVLGLFPHFPVKITLSGLKSMEAAFQATRQGGARAIFDKSNPETQSRFPATVAQFAALGLMLDNNCPDHADTLFMLVEHRLETVAEWVERSCMVRRRLEQICGTFLRCSPKEAILSHRALTYLQLRAAELPGAAPSHLEELGVTDDHLSAVMARYPRRESVLK
jgi:CheY-like chemotaxis protein